MCAPYSDTQYQQTHPQHARVRERLAPRARDALPRVAVELLPAALVRFSRKLLHALPRELLVFFCCSLCRLTKRRAGVTQPMQQRRAAEPREF